MSLLCAAIALLVEFQGSLRDSGGSGHVLQGAIEREDGHCGDAESREHGINVEGEEGPGKRADVSS